MKTQNIILDRAEARELWRSYKRHQHYEKPIDAEIRRAYQLLAQGRLIIKALESIKAAGLNAQGLPKLAITRATAADAWLEMWTDGSARFDEGQWVRHNQTAKQIRLPAGTFPPRSRHLSNCRAIVPSIPIHMRPKRGLANYHILWEAEWDRTVPRDPYLLRRIGKGDLWLVVAMWDLTEVERGALAARVTSA